MSEQTLGEAMKKVELEVVSFGTASVREIFTKNVEQDLANKSEAINFTA
jgi:hypothetical protein